MPGWRGVEARVKGRVGELGNVGVSWVGWSCHLMAKGL